MKAAAGSITLDHSLYLERHEQSHAAGPRAYYLGANWFRLRRVAPDGWIGGECVWVGDDGGQDLPGPSGRKLATLGESLEKVCTFQSESLEKVS